MTISESGPTLARDPVCGMNVNPARAEHVHEHDGKKYYFCCAPCVEKFKADPQGYLNKPASSGLVTLGTPTKLAPVSHLRKMSTQEQPSSGPESKIRDQAAHVCPMCPDVREPKPGACPSCGMALEPEVPIATTRTEYTCPMHPEIVRSEPGSCPICGMALEPRTVSRTTEENPELRDMTRRFWVGVALTTPLLVIAMGSMFAYHLNVDLNLNGFQINLPRIEFLLATPVVLWCGLPFFQRFWTSLMNRSPNMFTLIGLGTGVAYIYSVVATFAPQIFPQ
jgi:YHS domain-containing protein